MQNLLNKHHNQTTDNPYAASYGGRLSLWFPTKQSQLSLPNGVGAELETRTGYQEHDSSSTLSTRQPNLEAATSAKSDFLAQNVSFDPGLFETREKRREDSVGPSLSNGNADYISRRVQTEHHDRSLDSVSYPYAGSYFGGIASAYEPNDVVYPHVTTTLASTRAVPVIPLECTEGIVPIYVNAKQYHAILRRRQARAKLEAQNKITKSRKPYLHESRHRHALKRARGSGGRFLNTKRVQEPKPSAHTFGKNLVLQNISATNALSSESKNSWGASTSSGSDVSCIFRDDGMFPQPDLGVSLIL